MTHPLNVDPYVGAGSKSAQKEEETGTRHPSRFEPKQQTISSTQIQQRTRARVQYSLATQSIPNGAATNTQALFDTVVIDTDGLLKSNGFKIPGTGKITGSWLFHVHITWSASASGFREVNILQNGVQIASTHILGSNDDMSQDCQIIVNDPDGGNVYTIAVNQTTGGSLNLITDGVHHYFEVIHLW